MASAGASADIAARAELARQLGGHDSRGDGAVLQRGGVVVKLDETREALADFVQGLPDSGCTGSINIDHNATRHHAIHH